MSHSEIHLDSQHLHQKFWAWRKFLFLALGAILILALTIWFYSRMGHITENDARVKADMITISSRVDGWITQRPGMDGQIIHTGDELAQIDPRDSHLKLIALQSKLQSIHLQQEQVMMQIHLAQTTLKDGITSAQARLNSAKSQQEQSSQALHRAQAMVDHIVSRELLEQRQNQFEQAQANTSAADASLNDAQAKFEDLSILRKKLDGLNQEVNIVQTEIQSRELDLGDRIVRSPIQGIIDDKFIQVGEYVIPGQRLFLIHDPKKVWIEADLKETKIQDIKPGMKVDISVDAFPNRHFKGQIERIGNAATGEFALLPSPNPSGNFTKTTQRIPVRIAVDQGADNPLRPGMMAEIDIDTH